MAASAQQGRARSEINVELDSSEELVDWNPVTFDDLERTVEALTTKIQVALVLSIPVPV